MIGWLIFLGYAAGWVPAAGLIARYVAQYFPHCHREGSSGYRWTDRSYCSRWDGPNCWRVDGQVTVSKFAASAGLALLWPFVFTLIVPAYWFATRQGKRSRLAADIDRLEREAGIR